MNSSPHISKHLNEFYFGGSWTSVSLQSALQDVSYKEANEKITDLNSILTLTYHINYYVKVVGEFLDGNQFYSSDKESFNAPEITNAKEWNSFLDSVWMDGDRLVKRIKVISNDKLEDCFVDPKYGSMFRNLVGIIEHGHYHLGQIMLTKKILRNRN